MTQKRRAKRKPGAPKKTPAKKSAKKATKTAIKAPEQPELLRAEVQKNAILVDEVAESLDQLNLPGTESEELPDIPVQKDATGSLTPALQEDSTNKPQCLCCPDCWDIPCDGCKSGEVCLMIPCACGMIAR